MNKENNKLTIFFITSEIPSLTSGLSVRNYHLLKEMVKKGWNVKLFSLFDKKDKERINKLKDEMGIEIYLSPRKRFGFLKSLFVIFKDKLIPFYKEYEESGLDLILYKELKKEKPDIIQLELLYAYIATRKTLNKLEDGKTKIILDEHNAEYILFKESINIFSFTKKLLGYYLLSNFKKLETEALKRVDHVFSCSEIDKKYFLNFIPQEKISVIPNGVDYKNFKISESFKTRHVILFMGLFSYPPNNDGMKYYFNNIHPKIKAKFEDIKIYLVGKNPPYWLKRLAEKDKNIIVTGFVKDVKGYIRKARVCICPLRYGSGTRLKILEYMAMVKPVVSTTKGAEGLEIENYKNILIADNPDDFSNKIIWLFENPKEVKIIGKNARKLVEEKYGWNKIARNIECAYTYIVRK